ncbi:MAG: ATP-binding cassette domain-containing protein [Microthrixaceae bacterium]
MERFLLAVIAGVAASALIALLGSALLVRLRTAKVVDLGLAAVGMYLAYAYFELRSSGELVLPVVGLPARVHLVDRPTVATALAFVAIVGVVLGAAMQVLFYERLRDLPPLASLGATLGILLYFQQMVQLRFPANSAGVQTRTAVLPQDRLRLGQFTLSADRLALLVIAVLVSVALYALFTRTGFGRLADAATSSSLGAMCVGIVPLRVAAVGASLATMVAGVALILAEPVAGLGPTTPLLVIPALAAVLLGRLRSFGLTTAAAFGIGAVQAVILAIAVGPAFAWFPSWLPVPGLQAIVPTVVIIVVLNRRALEPASRGTNASVSHPVSPGPGSVTWGVAGILLITGLVLVLGGPLQRQALTVSAIAAILYLSVVVITGYSGQLSLLPVTTAGITGLLCLRLVRDGIPFLAAVAVSLGCAAALGWAAGRSMLKLRGMNIALVTLALAATLESLVLNSNVLGSLGDRVGAPVRIFGIDLGFAGAGSANYRPRFVILVVAILIAASVATVLLRRGSPGLRMLAAKSNERRAIALGVDVAEARMSAFVVGSVLAGISGVLTVFSIQRPSAMTFMVIGSIVAVALTTMAGAGLVWGAVLAAAVTPGGLLVALLDGSVGGWGADLGAGTAATYVSALSGISLALMVGLLPDGVVGGLFERLWRRSSRPDVTMSVPVQEVRTLDATDGAEALLIRGLSVQLASTAVLESVSLSVSRGQVVGLVGLNGAGKTTLFDACSGLVPITEGDILVDGRSIVEMPSRLRSAAGLGRTFQADELFGQMTVRENLAIAGASRIRIRKQDTIRADQLNAWQARSLSLEMAVATAPRVLLLDEPASGLDRSARENLAARVRDLAGRGVAIVVCDHDLDFVANVSTRTVLLEEGTVSDGLDFEPDSEEPDSEEPDSEEVEVVANAEVDACDAAAIDIEYLGTEPLRPVPGRLMAVAGTEPEHQAALRSLVGLGNRRPRLAQLARRGLSYVPEHLGLFDSLSVRDNLVLGNANRPLDSADKEWLKSKFPEMVGMLESPAGVLSGGERQLLALARALISTPEVLVVERPFHGLSASAIARTRAQFAELAAAGTSVVLVGITEGQIACVDGEAAGYVDTDGGRRGDKTVSRSARAQYSREC